MNVIVLERYNLANPGNQQFPNIEITADTLGTSIQCFFKYLKTLFVRSYFI